MTGHNSRSVLYFTNQYPKVSHSFIRRELRAVEAQGVTVYRAAFRGWDDATLVDPADIEERQKTFYTLGRGVVGLVVAMLRVFLSRPIGMFRAIAEAFRFSRLSDRGLGYHLVCVGHACRMVERLHQTPVDHMHVHFATYPAEVACLMRCLGGPPFSFTLHGPEEFDDIKRMNLERKVRCADKVVAITSFCRSQILKEIPLELWNKVSVVKCGLPDEFLSVGIAGKPDVLTFVNIGRFSPVKAQVLLVEAFAEVLKTHSDARLVLAGDGELRPLVEAKIRQLEIENSVIITGWIDSETVRRHISESTFMVHPSFSEGLPIVMMEAMAMGRPVIATAIAGHPELVVPEENGWLIPAGDKDALVNAMVHAAGVSDEDWLSFGQNAKKTVQNNHDVNRTAVQLIDIFFEQD